ncbi:hypothetical protein GGTG_04748 [Gaeumannomyces tritici R3-111a-1]|uniref:Uncharacterized protein n=1 Tax=Gaeumannomyces tritici (strain R3-111a-1) TaxID=644352 RepID=J3NTZ9_GAET3|nr:hypothetical protein GGTG_04748 [Gaeumannomyces tritici R3-111a-1]EJT79664.1 hypothetical protein GGTG_04748 [Gaeumannomyces tritici R3-111a-1]
MAPPLAYDILKTIFLRGRPIAVGVLTEVPGWYRLLYSQREFDAAIKKLKRAPYLVPKQATKHPGSAKISENL